ncbi:MAG: hypothetical protein ABSC25_13325 [Roseiarcus sp.]|jgi:hypothetical protein
MRSITLRCLARALAAALVVAGFATCAYAAPGNNGPSGHAAPAPAPAPAPGHSTGQDTDSERYGDPDAADACGGGLVLPQPSPFGDAGDAVKALSRATQRYISQCQCVTRTCIADALDQYAEALTAIAPRLPPELRDMPSVVAQAASNVRTARTKAQAVQAIHAAIAIIHKDMSLVRAEDPQQLGRETRGGLFVVDTLNAASLSLEKAGGL